MSQLLLASCILLSPATLCDPDKVNHHLQEYNDVNRAALAKLLQSFDLAEKHVKELQEKSITEAQKNTSIQLIRGEKKRLMESGRLPELANMIIPRIQYHLSLVEAQSKLLNVLQQEVEVAEKTKSAQLTSLTRQRDDLLQLMPGTSQLKPKNTWKGFRYNLVQRRYLYELSLTSVENEKFQGVLTTASKVQLVVEGNLNGSQIQFSIVKVLSGGSSPEQTFSGVLLGNRMLLKLQMGGVEYPTLLYLQ